MTTTTAVTTTEPARYWFLGGRMTVLLSGDDTAGALNVIEQELPAGLATPLHVQPDDDETFVLLEGEIELWQEGERRAARAGQAVFVARGTRHAFRVVSDGVRLISFGTPAGHEHFFALGGAPAPEGSTPPDGPLDMARMAQAAAAARVELLGPPPFADA
jgi:quercetin dioxygenase-like cupin family protein